MDPARVDLLVRLFAAVYPNVRIQAADVRERFVTNAALIWLILGVRAHVPGQIAGEKEGSVALGAMEQA